MLEKYSGPDTGNSNMRGRQAIVAGVFRPNDIVRLPDDKELLQCLQEMIGMKWNDKMDRVSRAINYFLDFYSGILFLNFVIGVV